MKGLLADKTSFMNAGIFTASFIGKLFSGLSYNQLDQR